MNRAGLSCAPTTSGDAHRRRLARARRLTASRGSSTCAGPRSSPTTRRATSTSRSCTSRCSARLRRRLRRRARRAARHASTSVVDHYAWSYVDFLERYRDRFGRAVAAIADADGAGRRALHGRQGPDRADRRAPPAARRRRARRRSPPTTRVSGRTSSTGSAAVDRRGGRRRRSARKRGCSRDTPAEGMVRVARGDRGRYGDVAGYLRAAGVDGRQLDRLRERLVAALSCATSRHATARSARCTASR